MIGCIQLYHAPSRRGVAAGELRNPARTPSVNLQDELVDVAMTFGWLRRPIEIEARWPLLMAGLRRVVDRVKAEPTARRRSPRLEVAIDWCHRSVFGVPLSEDAW